MIIAWPKHKYHGSWCCNGDGSTGAPDGCIACQLSLCTVCGGAESELTADCPGRRTTEQERNAVTAGTLDYKSQRWITSAVRPVWDIGP